MTRAADVLAALTARARPERVPLLHGFFQAGPGQYGEGDRFLGLFVPEVRALARSAWRLPLADLDGLLASEWHEARLCALVALTLRFQKVPDDRAAVAALYLARTDRVNNWDLVDVSAPYLLGDALVERDDALDVLEGLAASGSVWERRMAAVATLAFLRRQALVPTLVVAERLVCDPHDLVQKAVGWMLREAARRDRGPVEAFLERHAATMPRTMLRYALERFPEPARRHYLGLRVGTSPSR